jgi:hypothetical protein
MEFGPAQMEFAFINSSMCGPAGTGMVLPRSWLWKKMAASNMDRINDEMSMIWVNHSAMASSSTQFEGKHLHVLEDGSEVFTWTSLRVEHNFCGVVARYIPTGQKVLTLEIEHDEKLLYINFRAMNGELKCSSTFDTNKSVTFGYLSWYCHNHLMCTEGLSKFVDIQCVVGQVAMRPQRICWSPLWVDGCRKPGRRLFGKQSWRLQTTLSQYFAKKQRR